MRHLRGGGLQERLSRLVSIGIHRVCPSVIESSFSDPASTTSHWTMDKVQCPYSATWRQTAAAGRSCKSTAPICLEIVCSEDRMVISPFGTPLGISSRMDSATWYCVYEAEIVVDGGQLLARQRLYSSTDQQGLERVSTHRIMGGSRAQLKLRRWLLVDPLLSV